MPEPVQAALRLNADFDRRVLVHAPALPWVPSPVPGVARRMLDRIGDEVARATSLVRYDAGSRFSPHVHGGGEEFLVLEGVFQDEHGDYPAGTYVRNPPQSAHTPASAQGCVIFVKLWQFDAADRSAVVVRPAAAAAPLVTAANGVQVQPLHADAREQVDLETWGAGTVAHRLLPGGAELLVLAGSLLLEDAVLRRHSWLRLPPGSRLQAQAGAAGCRLWCKTGHLGPGRVAGGPP